MHRNEEQVATKLLRIAAKASQDKQCQFTSLFHLMDKSLCLECFTALKGKSAPGINCSRPICYRINYQIIGQEISRSYDHFATLSS